MPIKVSIIGAGNVGATCTQRLVEKGYADIVLVDIIPGLPQGKALDILHSAPILNFNSHLIGTNNYEETANSDVVVIASGTSRKPGQSRDELLLTNMDIIKVVTHNVINYSPHCIIIMVTNPVDAMTHLALHNTKLPRNKVLGLSGILDGARFSSLISAELNVSVENISPCILGEHGNNMLIIPRLSTINGTPITKFLPQDTISKLITRTINGGTEIVELLPTGSAFYAPSAAAAQMVDAIILDKHTILSCSTYLSGEYGIKDIVVNVPVKIGRDGIEQIIELELSEDENITLANAAKAINRLVNTMNIC
ncbi:malate dehydrogenase [Chloroflexota bacterium]